MSAAFTKKSILDPKTKSSRPTHLEPCLLPPPKTTILLPMQLHHHHIVVQSLDHLAKHIRGAKPQR